MDHLQVLKDRIIESDGEFKIALQGGGIMTVDPVISKNKVIGVNVDNLGNQPFLPIDVFITTISLLNMSDQNQAVKGSAQGGMLGTIALPINSIEGHVAKVVYGKNLNDFVFQRITPISRILQWAEVCQNGRGFLKLL